MTLNDVKGIDGTCYIVWLFNEKPSEYLINLIKASGADKPVLVYDIHNKSLYSLNINNELVDRPFYWSYMFCGQCNSDEKVVSLITIVSAMKEIMCIK